MELAANGQGPAFYTTSISNWCLEAWTNQEDELGYLPSLYSYVSVSHISYEVKILNKPGINLCHCLPFGNFKELTAITKNAYTSFGPKNLRYL